MLEVLKFFNYTPPSFNIKIDKKTNQFGSTGQNKIFEIVKESEYCYRLLIKGQQWMMYETDTHSQAAQLFSHYYLASGDVIVTGLGLAVRENWILKNPNVKSLTIIEKSEDVIEYHKETNPHLFEKATIICDDAKNFKGKCNTLLLDHYELETMEEIVNNVKIICNNIDCEKMWFWHLESQIIADLHGWYENCIWDEFRKGNFKFNTETLKNIKEIYEAIRLKFELNKLPDLTREELQLFLTMYTMFFQKL